MTNSSNNFSQILFNDYYKCTFTNGILIRYFGTLIFLIGMISTLLSVGVFARKPLRRKSCCFYFLVLAISDFIHLLTMTIEHLPYSFHIDLILIHWIICKITIFLIYFSNHFSNLVLTLASIDRFILIYCPSHAKRYCNIHKAKRLVLTAGILLLFADGHIFYGYDIIHVDYKQSNNWLDCNIHREKILYIKLFHFYDSFIESFLFNIIPFVIMGLCSILIIVRIVETRKTMRYNSTRNFYYNSCCARKSLTQQKTVAMQPILAPPKNKRTVRRREKDTQLSCMLIGTSFAFLLLCLPAEINDLFNYNGQERTCAKWLQKVMFMLMQQTYYAGHFYIFTLTGQLFRKHLRALIFGRRYRRRTCGTMTSRSIEQDFKTDCETKYRHQSIVQQRDGEQRCSLTTSIGTTTTATLHRPLTTLNEITQIPTVNNSNNEPSQRLLGDCTMFVEGYLH